MIRLLLHIHNKFSIARSTPSTSVKMTDSHLSTLTEDDVQKLMATPDVQRLIANAVAESLLRSNAPVTITTSDSGGVRNPSALNAATRDPEQKTNFKNPAIVGLLAFGMTTILLSLVNVGAYKLGQVNAAMALPFGGAVQLLCGILEYFNNNNFGFVAFTSYGAFWISLGLIWLLPTSAHSHVEVGPASSPFIGFYLLLWGLFTCPMLYCTLFKNVGIIAVFSTLTVTFFLLAIGHLALIPEITKAGGGLGIVCGFLAMYVSFAEILETNFGHEILPLIPLNKKR